MNILKKLNEKGFDTVPDDFYSQIDLWKSWYDGEVKDFHRYRAFNGVQYVHCSRYSMGMGKKVAEDWANLLLNEKVKITIEGNKEQEFFDSVCSENNFEVKANEMQEMKAALGTAAYVVRAADVIVNSGNGSLIDIGRGRLKIDYVTAQNIFPISWENGIVKECAFASSATVRGKDYLYLQIHRIGEDGNYVIENVIYRSENETLTPVNLTDVHGYENIPPVVKTGSPERQFVIDRLNISNNYDITLPMGIPAFANAIPQLKGVDIAFDSYINEFILGKKRVMFKPSAAKNMDGEYVFDPNEIAYFYLEEDSDGGGIIQPIDMNLRTSDHSAGLQDMLNALSSKCGFGENHYRFESGAITTATQVISENSSMFRTIKKHEIVLESVIKELCKIILRIGNTVLKKGLNEDVEISIDFDDSIIEDTQSEFNRVMQMVSAGMMTEAEGRSIIMNETIETAQAALPDMESLVSDDMTGGSSEGPKK